MRPWDSAARGYGSSGGPAYWLMRTTIGSSALPIMSWTPPRKLSRVGRAALLGVIATL